MLVEIFMKNIGSTFSLKNVATFFEVLITFFKHASENVDEKILATLLKMLTQKILATVNVDEKNVGKLSENVDEKKCWQYFRKMLTKNVGNTPKNVDEKMLATLSKNVDEKCW
jgi:hypothetical protein